jgi:hypothetical protein
MTSHPPSRPLLGAIPFSFQRYSFRCTQVGRVSYVALANGPGAQSPKRANVACTALVRVASGAPSGNPFTT